MVIIGNLKGYLGTAAPRRRGTEALNRVLWMASAYDDFLECVRRCAEQAGVFADTRITEDVLVCEALNCAAPASYRLTREENQLLISLVTADRWLSESIEAELMHSGDNLEELVEEELLDQGYSGGPLPVQHFRSNDLLYTFSSRLSLDDVPGDDHCTTAAQCLLAYEATFRELGDMHRKNR